MPLCVVYTKLTHRYAAATNSNLTHRYAVALSRVERATSDPLSAPERAGVRLQKTPLLPRYSLSAPERAGVRLKIGVAFLSLCLLPLISSACQSMKNARPLEEVDAVKVAKEYLDTIRDDDGFIYVDYANKEIFAETISKEKMRNSTSKDCYDVERGKWGQWLLGKNYWHIRFFENNLRTKGGAMNVFIDQDEQEVICIIGEK